MKYLVFSDIDGTLLNKQHELTDSTISVVKELTLQGIDTVLASARPPKAMQGIYQQLSLSTPVVAYNGALIMQQDQIIFSQQLNQALAIQLIQKVKQHFPEVSINIYSYQHWFVLKQDDWVRQEEAITATHAKLLPENQLQTADFTIHKLLFMGKETAIQNLEKFCCEYFNSDMEFTRSKATYLECVNRQVSKVAALQFLSMYLNIPMQNCLAIGDNYNDLEMISHAGIGVAMGNAPIEVQKTADWVTYSNNDEGFALAMKKFLSEIGTEEN